MSHHNYKKTYIYLWLLLVVTLAVVLVVSFTDNPKIGGFSFEKGTFKDVILAPELTAEEKAALAALDSPDYVEPRVKTAEPDTTVRTVLIFGDSMTILVANRMAAYGEKNGYQVVSVTWDGSSSVSWSSCDTLDNFIARYHPDFIMVTLGSNELFLKNFDNRKPYVEKLVRKIGNIPFVWIGPPNWKEDVGFNSMMRHSLPKGTFFDSNRLDLPRGADHIHPTPAAGIVWTDSIMSWMPYTAHPIPFTRPDANVKTKPHLSYYYKAGKGGMVSHKGEDTLEESVLNPHEAPVQEEESATGMPSETPAPESTEPPHSVPEPEN